MLFDKENTLRSFRRAIQLFASLWLCALFFSWPVFELQLFCCARLTTIDLFRNCGIDGVRAPHHRRRERERVSDKRSVDRLIQSNLGGREEQVQGQYLPFGALGGARG